VLEETRDRDQIVQRVAALDVGKAELTCCVRVPGPGSSDRRLQEVRTYQTMTRWLLVMADRLAELGVTRVVMEATSDYWKGSTTCWKPTGSRPGWSTPVTSSISPGGPRPTPWMRSGCASSPSGRCYGPASCHPGDPAVARCDPLSGRSGGGPDRREAAGGAGCREDAQIKLSVVASDIFGVSGRAMLGALIAGERDPKVLAQLARTRLRTKLGPLAEAFTGFFTDQHAFLLAKMLARVDMLDADLAELDAKLAELIGPFAGAVDRLDEIPGIGQLATQLLIAELGVDMTRFPTAGHLVSWAKYAPGVSESAGKRKGRGSTGHGNPYLARVLGEAAVAASKTDTFLGERYRRIARRRGKRRAIVAVGRSILVIVWHLLSDPTTRFHDLGAGFYDTRINAERTKRNHVRQLEGLGYKVTLEPAA
jgi:transposase